MSYSILVVRDERGAGRHGGDRGVGGLRLRGGRVSPAAAGAGRRHRGAGP